MIRESSSLTEDDCNKIYKEISDFLQNEENLSSDKYQLNSAFTKTVTHNDIEFKLPRGEYYIKTLSNIPKIKTVVCEICNEIIGDYNDQLRNCFSLLVIDANRILCCYPDPKDEKDTKLCSFIVR
ncbi:hypothetical protein [Edaphocola flava]|uniref:hypothetical protein n=1 Tax=Edaphocola flava TaxID=2499629 RepID=UPI00100B9120|nr:hypothetical protein [Edaphocola flava]